MDKSKIGIIVVLSFSLTAIGFLVGSIVVNSSDKAEVSVEEHYGGGGSPIHNIHFSFDTPDFVTFFKKTDEKMDEFVDEQSDRAEVLVNNTAATASNITNEYVLDSSLEKVDLNYVIDGDTIVVTNSSGEDITVRLLGVNTPESKASEEYLEETGKENNDYGLLSSDYTKTYLKDKETLYLEYDAEQTDAYGRTLAYVYVKKNKKLKNQINYRLLEDGMAEVLIIEPNGKYKDAYIEAESKAKENRVGLWKYDDYYEAPEGF